MKASERARRFREADRAEGARGGIGFEIGWLLGMACGATVAFVVAQLAAPDSQPWWIYAIGAVVGGALAWGLGRSAA